MAFSAHSHQLLPTTTPAPPPTPSNQSHQLSATPDALSCLFLRLPPTLSLPTRRRPSQLNTAATLPVISLKENPSLHDNLVSQLGFFQLTDHHVPSQLADAAELEAQSLFLRRDTSHNLSWPHGYDDEEDEYGESFCFDPTAPDTSSLTSLGEFAVALEGVGFEVVEALSEAAGFENPFKEKSKARRLLWVSKCGGDGITPHYSGRLYPYVVALQYQMRKHKVSLLGDSAWVSVDPEAASILVTIGDVAQVWSNGKLKKVRGRPLVNHGEESESSSISVTLLLSLPLESVVSPLPLAADKKVENRDEEASEDDKFATFSFEDYAWRVYHERLPLKDTLDRYRI
ncbi:1-aminocyclopropane-1-carboxylate oxidase homolog [Aristolochia californica]|uniref:1-aminocyclopropane-1-carboxylate oxidase homolog n=1 Tax=Aristolochia californica TaxID=171875 RepID=UPI0035DC90C4